MGVREFITPTEEEWIDALGVTPERAEGEDFIYLLHYPINSDDHFDLSFDVVGSSVRFRWSQGEEALVDILREGARRLLVNSGAGEAYLRIEFDTADLHGQLTIRVLPAIRIEDQLLFS
ncbi:hypothetical protein [Pseudonocardia spinosispora]|uniref:hypothetical protein n=1 Tax=Pseudonocardia spinosispora TaxID=103441 RepID=UPI0012EB4FD4|nr:hypothetical protein [Pseudonocardia spinosispora]